MDISALESKAAGSVVLRQVAWGKNENAAKLQAVKHMLNHKALKSLGNTSTPLFPSKTQKRRKKRQNNNGEEGTWISASCFFSHPNIALTLFEKFLAERGSLVEYNESGEYPKCEVEVVVDGNSIGKGHAKGMWSAKKFAIKQAYFKLKNADKQDAPDTLPAA